MEMEDDQYLGELLKTCSSGIGGSGGSGGGKDKAIAIFSCSEKFVDVCKLAMKNLDDVGIGHLAVATSEAVCDALGGAAQVHHRLTLLASSA